MELMDRRFGFMHLVSRWRAAAMSQLGAQTLHAVFQYRCQAPWRARPPQRRACCSRCFGARFGRSWGRRTPVQDLLQAILGHLAVLRRQRQRSQSRRAPPPPPATLLPRPAAQLLAPPRHQQARGARRWGRSQRQQMRRSRMASAAWQQVPQGRRPATAWARFWASPKSWSSRRRWCGAAARGRAPPPCRP